MNHALGGTLDAAAWKQADTAMIAALSDTTMTITEQATAGTTVFTHWVLQGTHTRDFMGQPAAGNTARLEAVTIDVVREGAIVEHNAIADFPSFMAQLQPHA